jgi:hypothetical protein
MRSRASGVIPGGAYTRSRLRGEPPEVYERIGPEMEALETATRRDPERPELEHYRRRDEIDLLVPVAQVGAPTSRGIQGAAIGRVAHPTRPPFARATDHRRRSTASSTR